MRNYIKSFFRQEDGIETIEFVALIAVAAVLIVVITSISGKMKEAATSGEQSIDDALSGLKLNTKGGNATQQESN